MDDFSGKYHKQFNYITSHYQFRFNVVTSFYEYRSLIRVKGKKGVTYNQWNKYDDRVKNLILLKLMEMDLDIAENKVNIFIESGIVSPDYNPFLEYFNDLAAWDEKTDYIQQIAETVKTHDNEHFKNTLKRFFVGTLDCLLEEDAVNDVCLVFQSGQGVGKTRWMRSLLPKKFQAEYLYEGNIDTKNKDHTIYLSQYWFIHLDELETLKSNDISAIKSYITRQRISQRKAFGRYTSHFVRRASFLGSVNDDKFLTDITGNRRWLVFKTLFINYEHTVDVDKLWAQVYYLWKKGYKHWFDIDEIKTINETNEQFRSMSLEEEMLLQCAEFNEPNDKLGEYVTSADALMQLGKDRPGLLNKLTAMKIGKALSKYSKNKKIKNGITKYYIRWTGLDVEVDQKSQEEEKNIVLQEKYIGENHLPNQPNEPNLNNEEDVKKVLEDDNDVPF